MENTDFVTYLKTYNKEEAEELAFLLRENKIDFEFNDTSSLFNPSFANNTFDKEYRIKLKQTDFERADLAQQERAAALSVSVGKDYYLYDFSNEELLEIIAKSDEWSRFDYWFAQKVLKDRGEDVTSQKIDFLNTERLKNLEKPEKSSFRWILVSYVLAVIGSLVALFIGWYLWTHKKTLPNGESVYVYSVKDRRHGLIIILLSFFFIVFWSVYAYRSYVG